MSALWTLFARWLVSSPARVDWLIARADFDRNPHNHPWNFRTIVLRGIYTEELLMPDGGKRYQVASRGQTYTRLTSEYHRVASVVRDGVWTMFIMGRKRCKWGFMVGRKHVYWREYLSEWEGA